jgi:hypothetical protein
LGVDVASKADAIGENIETSSGPLVRTHRCNDILNIHINSFSEEAVHMPTHPSRNEDAPTNVKLFEKEAVKNLVDWIFSSPAGEAFNMNPPCALSVRVPPCDWVSHLNSPSTPRTSTGILC